MAGHITKRSKNGQRKWRARYPDPSYGGKKEIERVFGTRREAERWLTNQQSAVHKGTHINPADTERRISDVAVAWRATWLELEPRTKADYESILNRHVLPRWRDARVGAVSADAIQDWVNEIAATRSPNTVRRIYGVLRSVMKVAVQRHYVTVNPCDAVALPKRTDQHEEMLFLTASEVSDLAEAITPHYRDLVYTAAYMGLRAGELYALRRRDVDLLHCKLHVRRALKDVNTSSENIAPEDKGLIFGPTKTGKARSIGLPGFLVAMLADLCEGDPDGLVFTTPGGHPIRQTNFYRRHFKPAVRRRYCLGCDTEVKPKAERCPECEGTDFAYVLHPSKHGLRFHDLRHTCVTMLIAGGAPLPAIKEHVGHQDIQTTVNVYGHLYPSTEAAMASTLDAAFEGSAEPDNVRAMTGRTRAGDK